jgi:hypothetical protein
VGDLLVEFEVVGAVQFAWIAIIEATELVNAVLDETEDWLEEV